MPIYFTLLYLSSVPFFFFRERNLEPLKSKFPSFIQKCKSRTNTDKSLQTKQKIKTKCFVLNQATEILCHKTISCNEWLLRLFYARQRESERESQYFQTGKHFHFLCLSVCMSVIENKQEFIDNAKKTLYWGGRPGQWWCQYKQYRQFIFTVIQKCKRMVGNKWSQISAKQ